MSVCVFVCIIKEKADDDDRRKNNGNCGKLQKAKVVIEIELKQSDVQKKKRSALAIDRAIKKKLCHIVREVKQISAPAQTERKTAPSRERERQAERKKRCV